MRSLPIRVWLWVVVAVAATATLLAATRTSLTFDEITLMSGGARGLTSGRYDLVPDHPLLAQYAYGAAALLAGAIPPADPGDAAVQGFRWQYAQRLLFASGSHTLRIAFAARILSCACGALLVLLVFAYTRRLLGPGTGLLAAALVAFLPDLLAHGGVAYNDLPLALLYFVGGWAAERLARDPGARTGALAGLLIAAALGVKFSGAILVPVLIVHVTLEARGRFRDPLWRQMVLRACAAAAVAAYVATMVIYRGDPSLAALREGLLQQVSHVSEGHEVATAYLLGATSQTGWWYFFPVVFFLKTPAAFHALLALALVGLFRLKTGAGHGEALPRAAWVGFIVYLLVLLPSRLAIGFRHALPLLPWLCVIAAAGLSRLWSRSGAPLRGAIVLLALWHATGTLSWYPHFLAYTSEYAGARDRGHEVLLDSNLDWGQGLLETRDFLRRRGIDRVFLSYFGSALPEAYGIDYVPLPSFLGLPERTLGQGPPPGYAVISATHLHGLYLEGDPFALLRSERPEAVLGHSVFVYRVSADPTTGTITAVPGPAGR